MSTNVMYVFSFFLKSIYKDVTIYDNYSYITFRSFRPTLDRSKKFFIGNLKNVRYYIQENKMSLEYYLDLGFKVKKGKFRKYLPGFELTLYFENKFDGLSQTFARFETLLTAHDDTYALFSEVDEDDIRRYFLCQYTGTSIQQGGEYDAWETFSLYPSRMIYKSYYERYRGRGR